MNNNNYDDRIENPESWKDSVKKKDSFLGSFRWKKLFINCLCECVYSSWKKQKTRWQFSLKINLVCYSVILASFSSILLLHKISLYPYNIAFDFRCSTEKKEGKKIQWMKVKNCHGLTITHTHTKHIDGSITLFFHIFFSLTKREQRITFFFNK